MSQYKHIYNAIDNAMRQIQQAQEYCHDAMHLDKESCGGWKKQLKDVEKQLKGCYKKVESKHKKASIKNEEVVPMEKKATRLKKVAELSMLADWMNFPGKYNLPITYSSDSTDSNTVFLFKNDFIDQEIIKAGAEPIQGQSMVSAWFEYDGSNYNISCQSNAMTQSDDPEHWQEIAEAVCASIEQSGIGDQIVSAIEEESNK
jgi:hypothetical protein